MIFFVTLRKKNNEKPTLAYLCINPLYSCKQTQLNSNYSKKSNKIYTKTP